MSSQAYKESIFDVNDAIFKLKKEYGAELGQLQQFEEARINFMKYSLDKFMRHMSQLGITLTTEAATLQNHCQFINSATDVKLFISENRSELEFPPPHVPE